MTRKDYIRIAAALDEAQQVTLARGDDTALLYEVRKGIVREHHQQVIRELSRMLKADNPNFDSERFADAAGFNG